MRDEDYTEDDIKATWILSDAALEVFYELIRTAQEEMGSGKLYGLAENWRFVKNAQQRVWRRVNLRG